MVCQYMLMNQTKALANVRIMLIFHMQLPVIKLLTLITSDGRFPYSKSKIEIFSQNRKKSKSRFYNRVVHRFLLTWNTVIFDRDNVATCW